MPRGLRAPTAPRRIQGKLEGQKIYDVRPGYFYATYVKPYRDGTRAPYTGRTGGWGDPRNPADIDRILYARDARHHMNAHGFLRAEPDLSSINAVAIRGREQLNIDRLGGAISQGGTSSNQIAGISLTNSQYRAYIKAARGLE